MGYMASITARENLILAITSDMVGRWAETDLSIARVSTDPLLVADQATKASKMYSLVVGL